MSLGRTNHSLSPSSVGFGTGSFTTGNFTSVSSSLLVALVGFLEDSGSSDPSADLTVSDSAGLTWTRRAYVGNAASWSCGIAIWTAPVTTGVSMTLTFDCGSRNVYLYLPHAVSYTVYNGSTPIGATAVGGSVGTDGAGSITLSGSPVSTSDVIAALFRDFSAAAASTVTHGTGWTELADYQDSSNSEGLQVQARSGSTSATVGWDDINAGGGTVAKSVGVAIEILAAGSSFNPAWARNANQVIQ